MENFVRHLVVDERDHIAHVDIDLVIQRLGDGVSAESAAQLYDFGKLLLDHVRGLRESHVTKLNNCLGWSSALLAIILTNAKAWSHGPVFLFAMFGAVSAIGALLAAAVALHSRGGWKWPSEQDWISIDYLKWETPLKIQRIIAMLESHQSYSGRVQQMGRRLAIAEVLLAVSGVLIGLAVVVSQFS